MKIVIEFYRTRDADDAHAVVGRETLEVEDLDGAIAAAQLLARTRDMPQRPDSMMITDASGKTHYSGIIGSETKDEGRQ
jgi:hypothetical protein